MEGGSKRSIEMKRSKEEKINMEELNILDDSSSDVSIENLGVHLEAPHRPSLEIPRIFEEEKQRVRMSFKRKMSQKIKKGKGKFKKDKEETKVRAPTMLIDDHTWTLKELAEKHQTNINFKAPNESDGLDSTEAAARLVRDGPNCLTPVKQTPMWVKFLKEFIQFFPLLLEAGGTLCLIAFILDDSTYDNLYLGIILWLVVFLTAIFSFMQEAKSASVMDGFKKLAPQLCKVHRDGKVTEMSAQNLVVGDVVELFAGDKIPADLRMIWVHNIKVDNSSLTGESEAQSRTVDSTDPSYLETKNLAFYTTLVQEGQGMGVVIRTGDRTVIGNIANLASSTKNEDTPLRQEIRRFIKIVSAVAISLGIIFLIIGFIVGLKPIPNIVFVIGIIVANVPEGLLPTVTVALTLTAKSLAKKKVLVKNLEAVETLGSTTTIASDKTGTLTMNRMTVVHVWYDNSVWTVDQLLTAGSFDKEAESFKPLQRVATLCNRAVFNNDDGNMELPIADRVVVGDASETALLKFCEPIDSVEPFRRQYPKVFEIPFNSSNKWQLSVHEIPDSDDHLLVMKGAPERVITRCKTILDNGKSIKLTEDHNKSFESAYEHLAGTGERVFGFAQRILPAADYPKGFEFSAEDKNFPMEKLTFVGLMALMDPPKPTVANAVAQCKIAGIRVIMVTGDHPLTAEAIARQVGILGGETMNSIAAARGIELRDVPTEDAEGILIKGSDIPSFEKEDWDMVLKKKQIVFARTSPEQKLQIVEECQARGEVVAVTGDGVNDSPALKKADLGCAMGISGSDVSKDAADVILLDDNFASIVAGVKEGRIIFDNLKKSIAYTLSSNSAELVPFIVFVVAQMPLALSAVMILLIDLGTDMVPAISLAYERPESDIMKRPPRLRTQRLVSIRLATFSYLWLGTLQAIAGFIAYFLAFNDAGFPPGDLIGISFDYFKSGAEDLNGLDADAQIDLLKKAQTSFFVAVVVSRMGCVLVCKTRGLSLLHQGMRNLVLNVGLFFELLLAVAIAYVPFIQVPFGTASVDWKPWLVGLPCFVFILVTDELRKLWIRRNPNGAVRRYTQW